MKFHLNHTPADQGFKISHADTLFLTGSCFSENIGKLLHDSKFKTYSNPSGILFNPLSIYNSLDAMLHLKPFDENYLLARGDQYLSYLHHSSISRPGKAELAEAIRSENITAHNFLKHSNYLIITFGTAYYYRHLALNAAVANCHKQPGNLFEKKLVEVPGLVTLYSNLIQQLQSFNPKLKLIFTVSPVKHLKDGLIENNISKATLMLAIHTLTQHHTNCFYFPAYELVNDDLRDYRFYKADMAHPNELAIEYVWQKFSGCYFSDATQDLNQRILRLNMALNHRNLHNNSDESEKLKAFISRQKEEIRKINPGIEL
jgi:hypothetical protein